MRNQTIPEAGERYKRTLGNEGEVTVIGVSSDEFVKFKDADGMHFVKLSSFNRYFKRIKNDTGRDGDR